MKVVALISVIFVLTTTALKAEVAYSSVCYEHHRGGSFVTKTIDESLGSTEGQVILAAACTYFTGAASACNKAIYAAAQIYVQFRES